MPKLQLKLNLNTKLEAATPKVAMPLEPILNIRQMDEPQVVGMCEEPLIYIVDLDTKPATPLVATPIVSTLHLLHHLRLPHHLKLPLLMYPQPLLILIYTTLKL